MEGSLCVGAVPVKATQGCLTHTHISHASFSCTNTPSQLCPFKLPQWVFSSKHHPASTYKFWHQQASDICTDSCRWDQTAVVANLTNCLKLAFISVKNQFTRSLLILKHTSKVMATRWWFSPDYFKRLTTFETRHIALKCTLKETVHTADCRTACPHFLWKS